jgi:hypothetical protein
LGEDTPIDEESGLRNEAKEYLDTIYISARLIRVGESLDLKFISISLPLKIC